MDDILKARLERAAQHVMTPQEIYEQKVSFIWGMQKLSAPGYTISEIKEMLAKIGVVDPESVATSAHPTDTRKVSDAG